MLELKNITINLKNDGRTIVDDFSFTLDRGEKVKVQLARLLIDEPDVLLLDEPTRNFSPLSGPVVRAALCGFGGTIISISHDRKYLAEVCDKIYELRESGLVSIDLQRC